MKLASQTFHNSEKDRIKDAIIRQLLQQKKETLKQDHRQTSPVILRAEALMKGLEALTWLCAQHPTSRGYWSDRENRFELAGCGGADIITGESGIDYHQLMENLSQRLATARGNPRYFGGLRFSLNGKRQRPWRPFKAYRFILPRFEVVKRNGATVFACNMLSHEPIETVEKAFLELSFPETHAEQALPHSFSRVDRPDKTRWCASVQEALDTFEAGQYEKVVLARQVILSFDTSLDAAALLKALKQKTTQCFHFLFQPDALNGFLGASPERLYRRDLNRIQTEAIAGSRPRGATLEEDVHLAESLQHSEKDMREHGYVVQEINQALARFCSLSDAEKTPQVLRLNRCQHLITRFKGKLKEGVTDADLLETLHPTPAVGGYPRDRALKEIARLEPFDRGWYAGPVGWIEKEAAQFVVGIRSGLTEGNKLHLFSGAGIVAGSVPEEEWEEIETKISDFLPLFNH